MDPDLERRVASLRESRTLAHRYRHDPTIKRLQIVVDHPATSPGMRSELRSRINEIAGRLEIRRESIARGEVREMRVNGVVKLTHRVKSHAGWDKNLNETFGWSDRA